jgi:hypothetical protein
MIPVEHCEEVGAHEEHDWYKSDDEVPGYRYCNGERE